jgi:hypothetical protein
MAQLNFRDQKYVSQYTTLCMCIYTMSIYSVYLVSDLEVSDNDDPLLAHDQRSRVRHPRIKGTGLPSLLESRSSHSHGLVHRPRTCRIRFVVAERIRFVVAVLSTPFLQPKWHRPLIERFVLSSSVSFSPPSSSHMPQRRDPALAIQGLPFLLPGPVEDPGPGVVALQSP